MLLAVTSNDNTFFKFLSGINNEMSVAHFSIDLSNEMDLIYDKWRKLHVLLLDNCASHKT